MTVAAWRIVKAKHAVDAFSGDGAARFGGRWNSPGTRLVYTAANVSLAVLELYVHLEEADVLDEYVVIPVRFDERLVESLATRLPAMWRRPRGLASTRRYGDEWAAEARSAVLRVPSAVIPQEANFLLNPRHPDFSAIEIGTPERFDFDARLLNRLGRRDNP
ncbi:MAG TPA: RES domain-containing protein [Planctomycetaceae bacterium]